MAFIHNSQSLAKIYAWFSAAQGGDTELLEGLLLHGMPVDAPHPLRHSTALMEATRLGRTGIVLWLLEQGAAPAFLCGMPLGNALHCALRRHHWEIAHILASAMDNCTVMDAYGATPLLLLCSEASTPDNNCEILALAELFIRKDCPLDALDRDGTTALHHCVINDAMALAQLLLIRGANPNALIPDTLVSPLTIAALDKNSEMVQLLIYHGADPELKTRDGSSARSIYPALIKLEVDRYDSTQAINNRLDLGERAQHWKSLLARINTGHYLQSAM